MEILARRYDTGEPVRIAITAGRIARVEPQPDRNQQALPWISPGLVDLQVNGFAGREFTSAGLTTEDVVEISTSLDRCGVTAYCPTVTTHAFAVLRHALATIAAACERSPEAAARILGVHVEGPYISPLDGPRGAHPAEHVRPPDWDEFQRLQEAAGGGIRLLTMSPEYGGAADFVRRVAASGVLVAIGHTAATSAQIAAAVDAGARLSTHLGNGAHAQLRRHPNYIWDQLAEDRLSASLIVDGHHLLPSVVKTFIRAKSPRRCILISDLTALAGVPQGRYENSSLGAVEVLEDGRLVIAGQRELLAGAALPIHGGITNLLRFTDLSLAEAIDMATRQPLQLLGIEPVELTIGAVADLVLFDVPGDKAGPLEIAATIQGGEVVWGREPRDGRGRAGG